MRLALAITLLYGLLSGHAYATSLLLTGVGSAAVGGGGGCTNKLDFSVACNSQYLNTVVGI